MGPACLKVGVLKLVKVSRSELYMIVPEDDQISIMIVLSFDHETVHTKYVTTT